MKTTERAFETLAAAVEAGIRLNKRISTGVTVEEWRNEKRKQHWFSVRCGYNTARNAVGHILFAEFTPFTRES